MSSGITVRPQLLFPPRQSYLQRALGGFAASAGSAIGGSLINTGMSYIRSKLGLGGGGYRRPPYQPMSYNTPYRALGWKYGIPARKYNSRNYTAGRGASLPGIKHGRGRGESRYVDNVPGPINIPNSTTNFSVYVLNTTQQGTAIQNRFANKIALKALQLKYHIQTSTSLATMNQQDIRIIVFYDKQTNGVTPAISDVLLNVDQSGSTSTNPNTFPNNFNRDRFVILHDKLFHLPPSTYNAGPPVNHDTHGFFPTMNEMRWDGYIKLKNIETCYKANSGGVGDISTGGLFILYFSSSNNQYAIDFQARLKFADN